jgi:hypothetical protein
MVWSAFAARLIAADGNEADDDSAQRMMSKL